MHGTLLNNELITAGKDIALRDGDELTFGVEVVRGSGQRSDTFLDPQTNSLQKLFRLSKYDASVNGRLCKLREGGPEERLLTDPIANTETITRLRVTLSLSPMTMTKMNTTMRTRFKMVMTPQPITLVQLILLPTKLLSQVLRVPALTRKIVALW